MPLFIVLSSWQGHHESSPGSCNECRLSAKRLPTLRPSQPTWVVSPPVGCCSLQSPSPFIIIISQPEGWYSFYHLTKGRRLSWPSWLATHRDSLPTCRWSPIQVLTVASVKQPCWWRPSCYS